MNTRTSPTSSASLPPALDLLLRGQRELDEALETPALHPAVIGKLLGIAVGGLAAHGLAVGLSAQLFALPADHLLGRLLLGPAALWMPLAFVAAFLGALSICLPSFYFYTRLAGLDASFRIVTAQALRTQATTSVFLLGMLPVYLALALTALVTSAMAPTLVLLAGLAMPFVVGLTGLSALFRGFRHMLTWIEITHERRGRFLLRLIGLWAAVYTVVAPVALYRAVERLSSLF